MFDRIIFIIVNVGRVLIPYDINVSNNFKLKEERRHLYGAEANQESFTPFGRLCKAKGRQIIAHHRRRRQAETHHVIHLQGSHCLWVEWINRC